MEKILNIVEDHFTVGQRSHNSFFGYIITTDDQTIKVGIESESS